MKTWKLEDAKNQFSELVRRAIAHQPQLVTRNGERAVVILSVEDYQQLIAPGDLVAFLRSSPLARALADGELDLERPRDLGRDTSF